jgi:hypothetical protein
MKKVSSILALLFLVAMMLACGGKVTIGGKDGVKDGVTPGTPGFPGTNTAVDPAEEPAIQAIKKHGGWVKHDESQANRPVIEAAVFMNSFTDADVPVLATLSKVQKIKLTNTKVTGAGLRKLAGLEHLTELDLWGSPIDEAGVKELASLTRLKVLTLSGGAKVGDSAFRDLAPLKDLEELSVEGMRLGNTAGLHIAAAFPKLRRLNIGNNQIGDVGVSALAGLSSLKILHLHGTRVTDVGLAALTRLAPLEELQVSFREVTDKSAKILSGCKNLRVLHLFHTEVTDKGLQELRKLQHLKELELRGSKISNAAIAQFIKEHPNCSVKQ